ncbi:MAG: mechanosensitive ion channel family protein [Candidatus Aminicenantia bacterium]
MENILPLYFNIIIGFSIILFSLVIGLIFQKILFVRLYKLSERTHAKWVDNILNSLKGMVIVWFLLVGISITLKVSSVPSELNKILQKIVLIFAISSVVWVGGKITAGFINVYMEKLIGAPTSIFGNITYIVFFLVGVMLILNSIGISVTPFITALGVGGLAVALALQETLTNLFAGLHIIVTKKIRPGDYIKLESGEEGYITDITWRNTSIKDLSDNLIIVPNSKLSSSIVTNFSLPEKELAVLVNLQVSYYSSLEKVEKIVLEVAKEVMKEVPGGVPEFEPFIRYSSFDESGITFTVILRAEEFVSRYLIKHEFYKRIHKRFEEEGIEIPFPYRNIIIKKEIV